MCVQNLFLRVQNLHREVSRQGSLDSRSFINTALTRPALRHLRDTITDALLEAGFQFDPRNPEHRESGNASRYTLYRWPYAVIAAGQGSCGRRFRLRPPYGRYGFRQPAGR